MIPNFGMSTKLIRIENITTLSQSWYLRNKRFRECSSMEVEIMNVVFWINSAAGVVEVEAMDMVF